MSLFSRFLQVDLNPGSRESAIMHGHCFSDVSHLYSWQRSVMRRQQRPENLSQSMASPRGGDWSGRQTDSSPLVSGVHHHSPGVSGSRQTKAPRWCWLITMLNVFYEVLSLWHRETLMSAHSLEDTAPTFTQHSDRQTGEGWWRTGSGISWCHIKFRVMYSQFTWFQL